jgi:hypothetical protein
MMSNGESVKTLVSKPKEMMSKRREGETLLLFVSLLSSYISAYRL